MHNDDKERVRHAAHTVPGTEGRDPRAVQFDEVKRQLGLNLIEATRDYLEGDGRASLTRYRR